MTTSKRVCAKENLPGLLLPVSHPCSELLEPTPPQETLLPRQVELVQSPRGHCSSPLGPGVCKVLFVTSKSGVCFPPSCGSPVIKSHWPSKSDFLEIPSLFARSPGWKARCGAQNLHNSGGTSSVLLFSSL